jgi:hypothetical protein
MSDKKNELIAVLVGDTNTWTKEYFAFKKDNDIIKEFVSSQFTQMPNPQYLKNISLNQPEFVTTVIISAILFYKEKKGNF